MRRMQQCMTYTTTSGNGPMAAAQHPCQVADLLDARSGNAGAACHGARSTPSNANTLGATLSVLPAASSTPAAMPGPVAHKRDSGV